MERETFGKILISATIVLAIIYIINGIAVSNEYTQRIQNHWTLADRASTLEAKRKHIKSFVEALDRADLTEENDAVFFKNPENSGFHNLEAVKSLAQRLDQIKDMDPNSFEYQTAIQQITAQEQGEATKMLEVLKGCWYKKYHFFYWDLGSTIVVILLIAACGFGIMLLDSFF